MEDGERRREKRFFSSWLLLLGLADSLDDDWGHLPALVLVDVSAGVAAGATNAALAKDLLLLLLATARTVASIKTDDEEDVIIDRDLFPVLFVGAMIVYSTASFYC